MRCKTTSTYHPSIQGTSFGRSSDPILVISIELGGGHLDFGYTNDILWREGLKLDVLSVCLIIRLPREM